MIFLIQIIAILENGLIKVDENGKKDLTELWEILIRDISSSLSVVFLVPMLTRASVTSYEGKSGFDCHIYMYVRAQSCPTLCNPKDL